MTDLSARNRANKNKGAEFEIDIVEYVRTQHPSFTPVRLVKTGREDEGDIALVWEPTTLLIEAKNEKSINLAGYVTELERERAFYGKHRGIEPPPGIVVIKRRNHSIGKSYVLTTLDHFLEEIW